MSNSKILFVLRRFNPDAPQKIGGVIASSENLIKVADKLKVKYSIVDTNKSIYGNKVIAFYQITKNILKMMRSHDHIALNLNNMELVSIAPIIFFANIFFKKNISLRVFGGDLDKIYNSNPIFKVILFFVLKCANPLFLQTKYLLKKFSQFNPIHLPTCRFRCRKAELKEYSGRFVFISQLKRSKGVGVILDAFKNISGVSVDFFGPLEDYSKKDLTTSNTNYLGILDKEDVPKTISNYDFLLFPTFYEGEGYPGIILESFSAGVPVIATNWRSIPEIVQNNKNGYLVPPNDPKALNLLLKNMPKDINLIFRKNAEKTFINYDCERVYAEYLNLIKD